MWFWLVKVSIIKAGAVGVVLALLQNDPSEKYLIQLLSDLSKVDVGKKAIASERGSMLLLANVFRQLHQMGGNLSGFYLIICVRMIQK